MRKFFQIVLYKFFARCNTVKMKIDMFFKIRRYRRLQKEYGNWRNIPADKMPQFFPPTPVDENSQLDIVLAFNEMAKAVNGELMLLDSGELVRRWLRHDFDDYTEVEEIKKFIHAEHLNKMVVNHFLKCGDLMPHQLEHLLNTSERFQKFYKGESRLATDITDLRNE